MGTLAPRLIVVPTDFSLPAAHALRYAATLGERFGAHLLVIHADPFVPSIDYTSSAAAMLMPTRDELIETAREQLQTFAETNIPASVPYDVRVIVAAPTDGIMEAVHESGADLIVMGMHGRTGLRRLFFGSVTEAVMRIATVPVIAIHESPRQRADTHVIVARERSTPEGRAAVDYAGFLADPEDGRLVEIPEGADVLEYALREGADLIALGVDATHDERLIRESVCPVLTVNRSAVRH